MERFANQALGNAPHIAVLGANKIGNFVVSTPVLRGLRRKYPNAIIDYFGSEATRDFETRHSAIDWRVSWDDRGDVLGIVAGGVEQRRAQHGAYELAINLDGFNEVTQVLCAMLRPRYVAGGVFNAKLSALMDWGDEAYQRFLLDDDWDSDEFLQRHKGVFDTNYIGELMCRMAYIEEDFFTLDLPAGTPAFDVPEVLIHCTTTRGAKMWSFDRWHAIVRWCDQHNLSVGIVGAAPQDQADLYHGLGDESQLFDGTKLIDLRGQTTLFELAGALKATRALITLDAGPMHVSAAVGCPTLAIFGNDASGTGASPVRLWMPRVGNVERTVSSITCDRCTKNKFKNNRCLRDDHACMDGIDVEQVIAWLARVVA